MTVQSEFVRGVVGLVGDVGIVPFLAGCALFAVFCLWASRGQVRDEKKGGKSEYYRYYDDMYGDG